MLLQADLSASGAWGLLHQPHLPFILSKKGLEANPTTCLLPYWQLYVPFPPRPNLRDMFGLNELPLRAMFRKAKLQSEAVRLQKYLVSRRKLGEVRPSAPPEILAETVHLVAFLNVQVGEAVAGLGWIVAMLEWVGAAFVANSHQNSASCGLAQ